MSEFAILLAVALVLDAVFGEPKWLWSRLAHPAVLIGRAIEWADGRFNSGDMRRAKGTALLLALVASALCIGATLSTLGNVVEILGAAILLAQRSLVDHVRDVAIALRSGLPEGRRSVARIVGRETSGLDESGVARGAIESAAENFSDGVVAPAFWFLILGLPGMLTYKVINTADSMIGYQTDRHARFGWAAARIDDLVNWIPARISALFICLGTGTLRQWSLVRRDAPQHRSPNAGWPEAAMAVGLDVALSGPRVYSGQPGDYPYVHPDGKRDLGPAEIEAAVSVLWRGWGTLLVICCILALI